VDLTDELGSPTREGVVTVVPGTTTRAYRYSSLDAVPWYLRFNAKQIGAAGFWYAQMPDTPGEIWDKITGSAATAVQTAHEAIGADKGVVGVLATVTGVPYPLLIVGALIAGYAVLRGAGVFK
jgi:hypothetical protein